MWGRMSQAMKRLFFPFMVVLLLTVLLLFGTGSSKANFFTDPYSVIRLFSSWK